MQRGHLNVVPPIHVGSMRGQKANSLGVSDRTAYGEWQRCTVVIVSNQASLCFQYFLCLIKIASYKRIQNDHQIFRVSSAMKRERRRAPKSSPKRNDGFQA